jgi:hypothetical protein
MSLASLVQYYASDTNTALDKFKDTIVSAGWVLYDDMTSSANYGYVLTSSGVSGNEMPCYLYLRKNSGTNNIYPYVYAYWDNVSHTGTYYHAYTHTYTTGSTSPFYINCSATEDSVAFDSYVGSTHTTTLVCLSTPILDIVGELQSGVSSGSSVVLTLAAGQADDFEVGKTYQIIDGSNRQTTTVSAKNTGSNQITVGSLTYSFSAGARIGTRPHKWTSYSTRSSSNCAFSWAGTGSANDSGSGSIQEAIFDYRNLDPDQRSAQKYIMFPLIFYDPTYSEGISGIQNLDSNTTWLRCYISSSKELVLSVGDHDNGTSSGSNTSSTLNDTTKSWTVNAYQNKVLVIHGGTGVGQYRIISNNSTNSLSISENWVTIPDATSGYTICDEGWLYLYTNNSYNQSGAMRIL